MRRSSASSWDSWTSFAPDRTGERYQSLYVEYDLLTRTNPGWNLTTIRDMPRRERTFWFDVALARTIERQ